MLWPSVATVHYLLLNTTQANNTTLVECKYKFTSIHRQYGVLCLSAGVRPDQHHKLSMPQCNVFILSFYNTVDSVETKLKNFDLHFFAALVLRTLKYCIALNFSGSVLKTIGRKKFGRLVDLDSIVKT